MTPEPGDPVALHGNRWWRVEALQNREDQTLIRYCGYGAEWDEWVGPDRFKVYSQEDARNNGLTDTFTETMTTLEPQADHSLLVQSRPVPCDLLVEWGGKWWPAEILNQEGNSYLIHYKEYGSQWDEWVTMERLGVYAGEQPNQ